MTASMFGSEDTNKYPPPYINCKLEKEIQIV